MSRGKKEQFIIERPEKYGDNLTSDSYKDLEKDFKDKKLHPLDLKVALAKEINLLLAPIREKKKELDSLSKKAFSE